jgi:hypothetical protein
MPTARELLDQADALMRRNRGAMQDDGVPTLTDAVPSPAELRSTRSLAQRAPLPELPPSGAVGKSNAPAGELADIPVLTDVVEEIEAQSLLDAPAFEDEHSIWPETARGARSVIEEPAQSIIAIPPPTTPTPAATPTPAPAPAAAPAASAPIAPAPMAPPSMPPSPAPPAWTGEERRGRVRQDVKRVATPASDLLAARLEAVLDVDEAAVAAQLNAPAAKVSSAPLRAEDLEFDVEPLAPTPSIETTREDAQEATVGHAASEATQELQQALEQELEQQPSAPDVDAPEPSPEIERTHVVAAREESLETAELRADSDEASELALAEVEESAPEVGAETLSVAVEPVSASAAPATIDDRERWDALAEEIRMQVLQRIDLFTDTGLREQLGERLQPIVDRASADLVATINQHVGELLRAYVAEAIEREIERWRHDAQ